MNLSQILHDMTEASARFEKVIFLAASIDPDGCFPDDLVTFLEEEELSTIEACLGKVPYPNADLRGVYGDEEIYDWLMHAQKLGFLVKVATPVMERISTTARTFSWSYYKTQWVYGDTMEQAITNGLKWVAIERNREDADADAKKGRSLRIKRANRPAAKDVGAGVADCFDACVSAAKEEAAAVAAKEGGAA